jgi:hypothetical protein
VETSVEGNAVLLRGLLRELVAEGTVRLEERSSGNRYYAVEGAPS